MKTILTLILTILFLSSCQKDRVAQLDDLFTDYSGSDKPGAAVMIIKDGKPLIVKTYGMANVATQKPVLPSSNFRLASVTKQYTAMCIMMLVEDAKLNYETTLGEIYPEFPEYGQSIIIRNILQHTSGLIDYEDLIPDTATIQVLDSDVMQMMMKQDSTFFEIGSQYRYSNSGYAMLAMIIEKISGQTFAEFLRTQIFAPLEMNETVAYEKGISTVNFRAYGHTVHEDSVQTTDQSITSAVLGDGGIYSSVLDLFKWDQALYTEKLVSKETFKLATTPHLERYGFGWRIDEYKGHLRNHHTGSTKGFRNVIQRFPDDQFTVIILSNRNDPDVAPLADQLVDWFLLGE